MLACTYHMDENLYFFKLVTSVKRCNEDALDAKDCYIYVNIWLDNFFITFYSFSVILTEY